MKLKLSYLHENRQEESKLILRTYNNFEKFTEEISFYKMAFNNICNNYIECDNCPYFEHEKEDRCFEKYLSENDKEIELE